MTHWLVIRRDANGALVPASMQVVEAASDREAATHVYMNAVVVGPVALFSVDNDDDGGGGPVAHLPAEGQPQ